MTRELWLFCLTVGQYALSHIAAQSAVAVTSNFLLTNPLKIPLNSLSSIILDLCRKEIQRYHEAQSESVHMDCTLLFALLFKKTDYGAGNNANPLEEAARLRNSNDKNTNDDKGW